MQRVDYLTIAGLGLLLMPLLTMWHEIGGHAAVCFLQGGHIETIGAFYVECDGLIGIDKILVACAGISVNALLAVITYLLWRRMATDAFRVTLWLIWVSEAFVASGYFLFSGFTGLGDLGIDEGGALSTLGLTWPMKLTEISIGAASYILLVRAAVLTLNNMIGTGPNTKQARSAIAHVYYMSAGAAAVLVGLLNPVGMSITIMSAAASSFGGLAGFISIGYSTGGEGDAKPISIRRNVAIVGAGIATSSAFALTFGPSIHFLR